MSFRLQSEEGRTLHSMGITGIQLGIECLISIRIENQACAFWTQFSSGDSVRSPGFEPGFSALLASDSQIKNLDVEIEKLGGLTS